MNKRFILIHGPTGVGKSSTIMQLGKTLPIEIVNCDVGQFYEPFGIGTAKPNWKQEAIPHHLFDVITKPEDFTVARYRRLILKTMEEILKRGNTPVLVGGSGFYGKSLFFPPCSESSDWDESQEGSWQELFKKDPQRATAIGKNDTYRIARALSILKTSDKKPSDCIPQFDPPPGKALVIFLSRERQELYERINVRTHEMFKEGWLEEVKSLIGTPWEKFLERKKLIGYTDILRYIKEASTSKEAYQIMIKAIQKKTRNYAKRQETFWRMFKKILAAEFKKTDSIIIQVNLTQDLHRKKIAKNLAQFIL